METTGPLSQPNQPDAPAEAMLPGMTPPDVTAPPPGINGAIPPPPSPGAVSGAKPGLWQSVLMGALSGLAGASNVRGRGGFGAGAAAGAENELRQQQIQTENQQRQQQINSDVQFKSAQAANMVVQGRLAQKQLDALPQKIQDEHTDQVLTQLEHIKQIFPGVQITVTPNDTKSITAAMASETKNNGGVGPALHLNAGDKVYSVDLNSLSSSPAGLVLVNEGLRKMGKQPLDATVWANMDTQVRNNYLTTAANFGTETPSDAKVTEYKGYLATVQAKSDYPQKAADIADLQKSITRFQGGADAAAEQENNREAAKIKAAGPAKAEAAKQVKLAEETTPGGQATLAKNQAQAEQAQTQATLNKEALGRSDDFGNKVGLPGEAPKVIQDKQKVFNKAYVEPLAPLVKSDMEFNRILSAGSKMTPAEKVTGLLQAVGISFDPLKGKGARLNNDIIQEHAGARDIYQGALQKIDSLRPGGGGPITQKQVEDYASIARGVVHDAYVYNAHEAQRQGLPVDFLPKASKPGEVAPDDVLKIYFDAANGDHQKALAALAKAGYK